MSDGKYKIDKQNVTITMLDVQRITDDEYEDRLVRGLEKRKVYEAFKVNQINLNKLFYSTPETEDIHKFNLLVGILHDNAISNLLSIILFLEEDYINSKIILTLLDENNIFRLKNILEKKHKGRLNKFQNKLIKTNLDLFIKEELPTVVISPEFAVEINGVLLKDK